MCMRLRPTHVGVILSEAKDPQFRSKMI